MTHTVSVSAKTLSFTNGTANDASPVDSSFTTLFNNDSVLATGVNAVLGTDSVNGTIDGKKLVLRDSFAGAPASGEHCGVIANRGTATDTEVRWDETNDFWSVSDDGTNFFPILGVKGANIASASSITLGTDGNYFHITGTTTITALSTATAGKRVALVFDGALTLTHNATSLILPGGANITTAAGDSAIFVSEGSGNWRCVSYTKASGTAIVVASQKVVQQVYTETGAVATGTTVIPADDTIPQNTEGDQYMSLAITPTNASNILVIEVIANMAHSATGTRSMALFQDSTADAIAATGQAKNLNELTQIPLRHVMVAGTASSTTFKIRLGSDVAGTTTFNGSGGTRRYGGTYASIIRITEYTP